MAEAATLIPQIQYTKQNRLTAYEVASANNRYYNKTNAQPQGPLRWAPFTRQRFNVP